MTVSDSEALYSLVAGEGDGAILGIAAGDTAGGVWELGYSAHTQQAVIIAYDLIEHGLIDMDRVTAAIREMDGLEDEAPVYRSESPEFRAWLDTATLESTEPSRVESLDHGSRGVVLGVANRRNPEGMASNVVDLGLVFHADAASILCGGVFGAAAAASCFGQSGRDLIAGVAEAMEPVLEALADSTATDLDRAESCVGEIRGLIPMVGITDGREALAAIGAADAPSVWESTLASLLIIAPLPERDHLPIEQAAKLGGSALGSAVGGVVGARAGIRAWPWAFANDTWFAEIGRRLVRGPAEVRDLPIPYAVEHHLMAGERQGFH